MSIELGTVIIVSEGHGFQVTKTHYIRQTNHWRMIHVDLQRGRWFGIPQTKTLSHSDVLDLNKMGQVGLAIQGFKNQPKEPIHLEALQKGSVITTPSGTYTKSQKGWRLDNKGREYNSDLFVGEIDDIQIDKIR